MLINVSDGEECRIAVVENGRLEEIYMERASATSHVGNIYKGRVTNVEPAIQAAFVDFGQGRNGFLHITDLLPTYFGKRGEDISESVGRKLSRRDRPPIQKCLKRGDEITVQIIKEGIGSKGPTLSTYLSIPGRILVMMPGMENFGVSRKIEDEAERRRLRKILDELDPIEGVGFIIRTAGMGKTKAEIERDLKYLTRLWETIKKISESTKAPVELYTEGDLVTRTVRDVYGPDIDRIIIDSRDVARRVKEFVRLTAPRGRTTVEYYDQPIPLFHAYNIEREIELIHSRHVPLPSGGSLVIDSTEAIVAIDVNSGKFRDHADAETTAFKTDMEAADEIPRQLKLRDLGGVIICDFIDLRFERHRRAVEQRLFENFKKDKAKTRILRMSEFGIIEVTRQRMRPSLKRSIYTDCPHCRGHGLVKTPESMALDVMRKLTIAVYDDRVARVQLSVAPEVATYLANRRRKQLAELEAKRGVPIDVRPASDLPLDDVRLELFDDRDGRVYIEALGMTPETEKAHRSASARREDRNGLARRQAPRLHTVDPDDDTPVNDTAADSPEAGESSDSSQAAKARRDRPEDHIRPIGMEPLREGAGHRGPRVVVPADADGAPPAASDETASSATTDGPGEQASSDRTSQDAPSDGETRPPAEVVAGSAAGEGTEASASGENGGRRRRRRRRGGRGRRRGREAAGGLGNDTGDAAATVVPSGPSADAADDLAGEELGTAIAPDAGRPSSFDPDVLNDEPRDKLADDELFEKAVGSAPTAITDDATEDASDALRDLRPDGQRSDGSRTAAADTAAEEPGASGPEEAFAPAVSNVAAVDTGVAAKAAGTAATESEEATTESEQPSPANGRRRRSRRRRRGQPSDLSQTSGRDAARTGEQAPGEARHTDFNALSVRDAADEAEAAGSSEAGGRRRRRGRGDGAMDTKEQTVTDAAAAESSGEMRSSTARVGDRPAGEETGSPAVLPVSTARVRATTAGRRVAPGAMSRRVVEAAVKLKPSAPRSAPTPVNVPPPIPARRSPTPVAVPPPIPTPPLVGGPKSADKHLADDEPVEPQPLRRPHTPRDLDAIPEDHD